MNELGKHQRPKGWIAIGIFLLAGGAMASIAGITLIKPGTFLDRMWVLNPTGHAGLMPLRKTVGPLFPVLALALAAAGIGWLKNRYWGWFLAVLLIGGNALGDVIRFASGAWISGAVGVLIAGSLLFYLTTARVRTWFQ